MNETDWSLIGVDKFAFYIVETGQIIGYVNRFATTSEASYEGVNLGVFITPQHAKDAVEKKHEYVKNRHFV